MPILYRAPITVEIDWLDDGQYAHTYSDVTSYLLSWSVRYGANIASDDFEVLVSSATGEVVLDNEQYLFSGEGLYAISPSHILFREHACRIRGDGDILLWEGIIEPPVTSSAVSVRAAVFPLRGALARDFLRDFTFSDLGPSVASTIWRKLATNGPILGSERINLPMVNDGRLEVPNLIRPMITGVVDFPYEGYKGDTNLRGFMQQFALFNDAYVFENHEGKMQIFSAPEGIVHKRAGVLPIKSMTSSEYYILRSTKLQEQTGLVRNFVRTKARQVQAGVYNDDGTFVPGERSKIASINETLLAGEDVFLTYKLSQGVSAERWQLDNLVITNGEADVGIIWPTEQKVELVILSTLDTTIPRPQITVRADITALVNHVVSTESLEYYNSPGVLQYRLFRQMFPPPWYWAGQDETLRWKPVREQTDRRAIAPHVAQLTLPLWQLTKARTRALMDIHAGEVVQLNLTDDSDGVHVNDTHVVMQVELTGNQVEVPKVRLYTIDLDAREIVGEMVCSYFDIVVSAA